MSSVRTFLPWVLAVYIVVVFVQSLFFKFSNSPETVHIFTTVGTWLGIDLFSRYGGYAIGTAELVASILLVIPRTQFFGALLALGIISGAIFFHLASPLGVVVASPQTGVESDGGLLFILACGVWVAAAVILVLRRGQLSSLLGRRPASA
jgi:hypothetical protein